jgi:hypothetical protein
MTSAVQIDREALLSLQCFCQVIISSSTFILSSGWNNRRSPSQARDDFNRECHVAAQAASLLDNDRMWPGDFIEAGLRIPHKSRHFGVVLIIPKRLLGVVNHGDCTFIFA